MHMFKVWDMYGYSLTKNCMFLFWIKKTNNLEENALQKYWIMSDPSVEVSTSSWAMFKFNFSEKTKHRLLSKTKFFILP